MTMYYYQPQQPYFGAVPDQLSQYRTQQTTPQVAQPTMQAPQSNSGLIWVQGETGAKSYLVAPGNTVMLMDSEGERFYLKSADASGMPLPLRVFEYKERTSAPVNDFKGGTSDFPANGDKYVTHEELERRLASIVPQTAPKKTTAKAKEDTDNG